MRAQRLVKDAGALGTAMGSISDWPIIRQILDWFARNKTVNSLHSGTPEANANLSNLKGYVGRSRAIDAFANKPGFWQPTRKLLAPAGKLINDTASFLPGTQTRQYKGVGQAFAQEQARPTLPGTPDPLSNADSTRAFLRENPYANNAVHGIAKNRATQFGNNTGNRASRAFNNFSGYMGDTFKRGWG